MVINKIQEGELFRNNLNNTQKRPNPENERRIENASFPMKGNSFFEYNPVKLAAIEWDRLAEFSEDIMASNLLEVMQVQNNMMRLHGEVSQAERNFHDEIPIIAEDIIRQVFNVPNNIQFEIEVGMAMEIDSSGGCDKEDKEEAVDKGLLPYVHQRQVINSIIHGASVFLTERLFFVDQETIDALDERLIPLYQQYSRTVNLSNWYVGESMLGGDPSCDTPEETQSMVNPSVVDIEKTEDGWLIKVKAPNMPLILHECVKGVLELLSYWALPKVNDELDEIEIHQEPINRDLTTKELELVLKVADSYRDERWYYYMGPTVWSRMLAHYNVPSDQIANNLQELYKLTPNRFLAQMENIVYNSDV
jgi:hypothetical protein